MKDQHFITARVSHYLAQSPLGHLATPLSIYLFLLQKWNAAYNLTAIRDIEGMIEKHLLDSLAVLPWLRGNTVLDVGSGAGLPGIPLAIANPKRDFVLLDSNGKKTRFLQEVKRQLQLKNVEIVQFRAENYHPARAFDTVVSRAFSSIEQMIYWTQHLISNHGLWLAMKGRFPEEELHELQYPYQVVDYKVPGIEGERCCVLIENRQKEP